MFYVFALKFYQNLLDLPPKGFIVMKNGLLPLVAFIILSIGLNACFAQSCSPYMPGPCDCSTGCGTGYFLPDYSCGSDYVEYFEMCIEVPCFYGRADAVLWNLGASNRALVEGGTGETAFTAKDFSRSGIGSPRILLGHNITPMLGIEGQYNGFQEWQSTKTLAGGYDFSLPGALGKVGTGWGEDFAASSQMTMFSETNFHSAELNLVRRTRYPSLVWLGGFRYFNFEENFDLRSTPWANVGYYQQYSDYTARTTNNLYGGQLGAKWDYLFTECFGLQAVGKVGVHTNNTKQRSWIYESLSDAVYQPVSMSGTKTSFSSEVNLGGYFKVTPNVSIVGGYNLMWIGDIARAADQLDFNYPPRNGQIATDTLFMHGANVGLEWSF